MSKRDTAYTFEALELLAARFRVFSDPTRLRILTMVGDRALTVSEIARLAGTSRANASRHLAVLLDAGLVSRRRDQTTVHYQVSDPTVLEMCEGVCQTAPAGKTSSVSKSRRCGL